MDLVTAPRRPIMGVAVHAMELADATDTILRAARLRHGLGVSALAVHGLVLASRDPHLTHRVNELELVVPDGQPVRWALNRLHEARLSDRVMGPELMLSVCRAAASEGLPIFLFGSTGATLDRLAGRLRERIPDLRIAGLQQSRFRTATPEEAEQDVQRIRTSGARIVFVGLGCPRQEIWVWENRLALHMPALAVGAAFDYHAGLIRRAPSWMSAAGLEWLFRLLQEPRRLWRRYSSTNPRFILGVTRQALGKSYDTAGRQPSESIRPG